MLRSHRPAHPSPPNTHQRERAASKALARTWHNGGCVYFSPTNYQPRFQWQQPIQWDVDASVCNIRVERLDIICSAAGRLDGWVDEHWLLGERCFHYGPGIWRQLWEKRETFVREEPWITVVIYVHWSETMLAANSALLSRNASSSLVSQTSISWIMVNLSILPQRYLFYVLFAEPTHAAEVQLPKLMLNMRPLLSTERFVRS
jgi:hypothetical protein